MQIIKVPSVFSVKLPGGEWLNLALIRRLELKSDPFALVVTWENGDNQEYRGDKALAILEAWEEASFVDKSGALTTEVGFVDGQLLANGATPALVTAVIDADDRQIMEEILKVGDKEQRDRLINIIQRLGEVQGSRR